LFAVGKLLETNPNHPSGSLPTAAALVDALSVTEKVSFLRSARETGSPLGKVWPGVGEHAKQAPDHLAEETHDSKQPLEHNAARAKDEEDDVSRFQGSFVRRRSTVRLG
jgi:hypothetical protein